MTYANLEFSKHFSKAFLLRDNLNHFCLSLSWLVSSGLDRHLIIGFAKRRRALRPIKLGPVFVMSLSSSPLQDTICETSMKGLIAEAATFISNVLPPILCYFAMAALAITPRTHTVRIALFPVVAVLALRAAVPMDMSLKITERKHHHRLAVSVHFETNISS